MLLFIFFATICALIDPDLHAYLSKKRMRSKPKQFAFTLFAIGAWIAKNSLAFLYILYLEMKYFLIRHAFLQCRPTNRQSLLHLYQSLPQNSRKRKFFQYIEDYAHEFFLSQK